MDIRKLYHLYKHFLVLKAWYFLLPALIFALIAVNGLRSNYATMVTLRSEVYQADEQNGDVEGKLRALREHVLGHMNTNLTGGSNSIKPPIQLKARYDRLVAAEQERVKQENAAINATAEQTCAAQFPSDGLNVPRITCVQQYIGSHAAKTREIPEQLYKFDFVSPQWSPDQAGISIVLSAFFTILFVARIILERYVRRRLQL